ncbi:hypothetical protein ACXZ1K_07640 [Pedobacter sp. PWIIR3]
MTSAYPNDFVIKPRTFYTAAMIYVTLFGLAFGPFVYYLSRALHYPIWLQVMLYLMALISLYEGLSTLLKPISLSYHDEQFRAGYLISSYTFKINEISGYRSIAYTTKFGIRNGVVLYMKNKRVTELNEVLMNGEISILKNIFEENNIPRYGKDNIILWVTRFPRRYQTFVETVV